ncbi:hypothetical protein ACA29_23025 [Lederbergia galactosidilytica]|uniref:Uncharacterized protein n=1 Tax=Lederbergia galactosidilytica TaxID=217031 RepID=A0A0Q9XMH5_9BACI|nr:hypothetical protein ACA29_23025 [Lederbergia galactosidilytica]
MKKQGLILTEQHGKHHYDRTNWYALSDEGGHCFAQEKITEEDTQVRDTGNIQDKITIVEKQLKKLRFFPLQTSQRKELAHACKTFSLAQISQALEATAERAIFAWKYAYKILLTNQNASPTKLKRKIIRTEKLPDWFQQGEHINVAKVPEEWNEETLIKRRRLLEIQEKYQQQKKTTFSFT